LSQLIPSIERIRIPSVGWLKATLLMLSERVRRPGGDERLDRRAEALEEIGPESSSSVPKCPPMRIDR
jgi:hypothetical protein